MKKKTFFILILLFSLEIKAQTQTHENEYKISLTDATNLAGRGDILFPRIVKDYAFLQNIPAIECDSFAIRCFKVNRYIQKDSIANQIYLFVGINNAKKLKHVAIDTNRNLDFIDNAVHIFSYPETRLPIDQMLQRCITLQIPLGNTQIPLNSRSENIVHIGLDPYGLYSPDLDKLEVLITYSDFMTTKTILDNIPVEINGYPDVDYSKKELTNKAYFNFEYNDKAGNFVYKTVMEKDTFQIQDNLYQLTRIEHPNIFLKSLGVLADSSSIGSFVPTLYAKDMKSKSVIQLNKLIKGKYVFIDFWSSWCGPCIGSIPKLKTLYDKVKHRKDVFMLGLATDKETSLGALEKIIKDKKVSWDNYWLDENERKSFQSTNKKLNVTGYPTYLILDNTGKIVYRDSSGSTIKEAAEFFLDLIAK